MYDVIVKEYEEILFEIRRLDTYLNEAPQGYISKKKINNKTYFYLQRRVDGKVQSKYIKEEDLEITKSLVERCQLYKDKLEETKVRKGELESASKLLSKDLYKKLIFKKMSDGMDRLSLEEKEESIGFANAINAIEGVPISKHLENDLDKWKSGEVSYSDLLPLILSRATVMGGM